MNKCSFGEGVVIKPDGTNELDPCIYDVIEEYANVTVRVLKCSRCGHVEVEWSRQSDTVKIVELATFPDADDDKSKIFAVPEDWLIDMLESLDDLNERKGVDLDNFLQNYCYDETWFIYNQAIKEEKLIREG